MNNFTPQSFFNCLIQVFGNKLILNLTKTNDGRYNVVVNSSDAYDTDKVKDFIQGQGWVASSAASASNGSTNIYFNPNEFSKQLQLATIRKDKYNNFKNSQHMLKEENYFPY